MRLSVCVYVYLYMYMPLYTYRNFFLKGSEELVILCLKRLERALNG